MKPVRLPAAATVALPRWAIFALCLLYILPGLIGRDPWKGDDASAFGVMWTMAHGSLSDWLWPHVAGMPTPEKGPLAYWIGALFIRLFGGVFGDPMAARLAGGIFFMIGAVSVWYATYLLGRRPEAQPMKLAFGGQPDPRDFGRTLADGALLIYIASLGLLLHSHETSVETLQISLIAFLFYQSVRLFDTPGYRAGLMLGATAGLLALTKGWVLPLAVLLTLAGVAAYRRQGKVFKALFPALLLAALPVLAWRFGLNQVHPFDSSPFPAWMEWNYRLVSGPTSESVSYTFKYLLWFAWPAWPFAIWAVYAWRRQEKPLHILLPVAYLLCFLLLACLNKHSEETILLPILPVFAILAAFGLTTVKRSTINAVDWFSVMIMTGVAGLIWLGWIAQQTGWPKGLAQQLNLLLPDYNGASQPLAMLTAMLATVAWFALVYWRISRRPAVLWRAVVLSGGGVILCWLLLMTLWLPWLNQRISYASLTTELSAKLPVKYKCVDAYIGASQRASFAYFGDIRFAGFSDQRCDYLLLQHSRKRNLVPDMPEPYEARQWESVWIGHRAGDKDELFTLYRRRR